MITGRRFHGLGVHWYEYLKDRSNAFASHRWTSLDKSCNSLAQHAGHILCRQRYRTAGCTLPSRKGSFMIKPGCGALQGDPFAVTSFVRAFKELVDRWTDRCQDEGPGEQFLWATFPSVLDLTSEPVYIGLQKFAGG
ncbi:unnamed protein product [Prorocentrum cordatum]|uniref:Uncharacterized protein n=1 Tax=Prorocentrum cordatum TaxID=2364126 RepID=A0ABN9U3D9_9DINO|nr:unnamed protein product [Polarella glacialis]